MAQLMSLEAEKALDDALVCVQLEPNWAKGHYRKAAALEALALLPVFPFFPSPLFCSE